MHAPLIFNKLYCLRNCDAGTLFSEKHRLGNYDVVRGVSFFTGRGGAPNLWGGVMIFSRSGWGGGHDFPGMSIGGVIIFLCSDESFLCGEHGSGSCRARPFSVTYSLQARFSSVGV